MAEPETLAFDLYGTLVDPLAISTELGLRLAPDDGLKVSRLWRATQIEYMFRVTIMSRYRDFRWITARALNDALAALGIRLSESDQAHLVDCYENLPPFPDVTAGLKTLRAAGHTLTVLSNGTLEMIQKCLATSGLSNYFWCIISADTVQAFKPSPLVYRHASDTAGSPISLMRLVSSNPFDVIGASSAGMRTAWCNRDGRHFDTIAEAPDITVASLTELASRLDASGESPTSERRTLNE